MNSIKELVTGKKVCVVGSAPAIMGSDLGEHIDSYDVVVRANCHWPIPKFLLNQHTHIKCDHDITIEYSKTQIGNKTNILFHGGFEKTGGIVEEIEKLVGLQLVALNGRNGKKVWPGYNEQDVKEWCKESNIGFQLLKTNIPNLPSPTIGFIAIDNLLKCNIDKLFICGFDFFRKVDKTLPGIKSHSPNDELMMFVEKIKQDKRIVLANHVKYSILEDERIDEKTKLRLKNDHIKKLKL